MPPAGVTSAIAELRDEVLADAMSGRVTHPVRLARRVRELPEGTRRRKSG
jgi:hypothetical protein